MHRNTRRFGAAVMAAGSLLILSACSAPRTAPPLTPPAASAPAAPATIVDSTLVSGASTLEDGNSFVAPIVNDGETGTYVSGSLNLTIHCSPKTWDAEHGQITTEVTVTNNGDALEHVILVVDALSPAGVSLANGDAMINGKAYVYFGHLAAGATSQVRVLRFDSESMVDYRCVTHIEARPSLGEPFIGPEDLDGFFQGLELDENLEAGFEADFGSLLDFELSIEQRIEIAQRCIRRLEGVSDPECRELVRLKLADCLYTGLKVELDDWLSYVTDSELDAKIRAFVWELSRLEVGELLSVRAYLLARFEAECLLGLDAELANRLRTGFGELVDFYQSSYLTLL